MTQRRPSWTELLLVAGFLILPLLLFGEVTLGGKTMLPVDNLYQWPPWSAVAAELGVGDPQNPLISDLIIQNYAWKRFIRRSVAQGELPLWNPYLFAGAPFLATGQNATLYPFSILFLILPLTKAYGWFTVSQLWLAGVFMYVFGRVLGLRRAAAFLAGIVYQGCGFMLASAAVFPMIISAAAWLPLLLAAIEKITTTADRPRSPAMVWLAVGAIALGCQILAGHVEITYYTLLVMALYAAWRLLSRPIPFARKKKLRGDSQSRHRDSRRKKRLRPFATHFHSFVGASRRIVTFLKPAVWLLAMVTLGLMLGAVQFVPLFEVGQANFREGAASLAQVRSWGFPARRVLTLMLPNFFGNPTHQSYVDVFSGSEVALPGASEWGFKNYVEGGIYVGILPLFLAALGVWGNWRKRAGHTGFFLVLSFFSLAFIFGTPLYALLYYGLPFINQLHTPFRWVFPLSLCVAALAGFGVDWIGGRLEIRDWRLGERRQSPISSLRSPVSILSLIASGGGVLLLAGLWVSRLFYGQLEPLVVRIYEGLALAGNAFPDARAFYSYEFRQLLLLGVMLVGTGVVLWLSQRPSRRTLWLWLAAGLIILDLGLANVGFHSAVSPTLLTHKPNLIQWLQEQPGHWRVTTYTPDGSRPLPPNTGWHYDIQDVRGYDSIIPKQYTDYVAAIEPQHMLQFNQVQPITKQQSLSSPLLDVLNVKYVVTGATIDLPQYQLAWEGEGLRVYENLGVAPRAYTLPQTATAVVDNPLTALTQLDPRHYVVVDEDDWRWEIGDGRLEEDNQSPTSNLRSPTPANISHYSNIEVIVEASVNEPSWLILNDSYFPGWKAFVRPQGAGDEAEQEVAMIRVNGNFRGVALEPGDWTVRFRYSPLSFKLGGLISAMGGLILLFAVGVWGWQRRARRDGPTSVTRSIAKNSFVPMALNLFNKAIDFVFAAFYLRVLGPADAGSFANAIIIAGFFDIVSNFGLNILLIRDVSQERDAAGRYLLNTTVLRLGTGLVASLPVLTFVWGTDLPVDEVTAVILIMVGMVFSGMAQGVTGLFYVHEQAEVPAAMTTVTTILKVGLGVTALLLGFGFVGLAAVSIITNIVTLALLAALALRRFPLPGPWTVDWLLMREMVRRGYPLMLIHLLQTVFIGVDVVILRQLSGETVVGWYSSAYKWFNALQIVPSFFTLALFPIISREIDESIESARRMYRLSLKLMLLLALPIAAATTFAAYFLVDVLADDAFLPHGAIALQIVIWAIPLGWLNSVTNYVLIALGLERLQPRAFAFAVGFNVITNLIFIPLVAFGYPAAAVTTVLSELVLLVLFDYYLRQRMAGLNWARFLGRPFLATAFMLAVMVAGNQIHWTVAVALGLPVYAAGLWLLGVIGEEERQVLADILPTPIAVRLKLVS